eukprot:Gregarina_sp_Poly_1__434@NODE_1105_length_5086_cov_338_687587_g766_i0_p7_GENE_NODE_1105_length_5086_cov_338_687587_g766_i0NODE_1105_length_5086_cov_338_687587_g766_i0_p7_ORF_typecomplete_len106_score6_98_NODE_1105_length_5086_cov_338_687587_g766_i044604777
MSLCGPHCVPHLEIRATLQKTGIFCLVSGVFIEAGRRTNFLLLWRHFSHISLYVRFFVILAYKDIRRKKRSMFEFPILRKLCVTLFGRSRIDTARSLHQVLPFVL